MIGEAVEATNYELVRWARQAVREHGLKPREALVLYVLCSYANREGLAWPSLETLARDCGYKPTDDGRCSAVSAALDRLVEVQLVWPKQSGRGRAAVRELLYRAQPSALTEGKEPDENAQPSALTEGSEAAASAQPSVLTEGQPSVLTEEKYQYEGPNDNDQQPKGKSQECLPSRRKASHPGSRKAENGNDDERERVRQVIAESPLGRPSS